VSSQHTMTYAWVVARTRSRNACKTRADLLSAARRRFGTEGYDRTTIRAIAADVGVDAALVLRYFGSKQELFAAAADLNLDLPDLTAVAPGRLAGALLARFFAVWEDDETFLALLRASMTSESVAETLRQVFAAQVEPTLSAVVPDHPRERAGLVGAFIIGLATTRYALAAPGLAAMDRDQITAWATPVVDQLLTGPAPPVPDSGAVRQLPRRRPERQRASLLPSVPWPAPADRPAGPVPGDPGPCPAPSRSAARNPGGCPAPADPARRPAASAR
jgi:AcrR family transcriptional regulator